MFSFCFVTAEQPYNKNGTEILACFLITQQNHACMCYCILPADNWKNDLFIGLVNRRYSLP